MRPCIPCGDGPRGRRPRRPSREPESEKPPGRGAAPVHHRRRRHPRDTDVSRIRIRPHGSIISDGTVYSRDRGPPFEVGGYARSASRSGTRLASPFLVVVVVVERGRCARSVHPEARAVGKVDSTSG